MKPKSLFLLHALIAGLGLMPAGPVTAQTFTTLHSFAGFPSDGYLPSAGLILSGDILYGTTEYDGSLGFGTVFAVNTDGAGFRILYNFTAVSPRVYPTGTNSDGANPVGGLILSGNTLYGTAEFGGTSGAGTMFKVNTDGTAFTTLHRFGADSPPRASLADWFSGPIISDGALPRAGLVLLGNTLYGTTPAGGWGNGTVFAVNTDGTGFTNLHTFTFGFYGNSDGAAPSAGLILSGNTLYGTALYGGSSGQGTVFAVNTDGTGFTTLHNFAGYPTDGAHPAASLILSGNTLYGTTDSGGSLAGGTVFKVNSDGTGFTTLYSFTAAYGPSPSTNSDGAAPEARLILSGDTLYGTARFGGSSGNGTVFGVNTDGTGFTNLHSFAYISDGAYPVAGLILSGKTLYGTTQGGGSFDRGTVFKLFVNHAPFPVANIAPLLAISPNEIKRFILSPDNVEATVVLDGSQSSDSDNDPLQFFWYGDGQTTALTTGALASNQFAVGAHTVQLAVSDGYDTATVEVSFEIITPAVAVGQLALLLDKAELGTRNKQPLLAALFAAMSAFDRRDFTAAINKLSVFQNKVRTQVAPRNPTLASELIAATQKISDAVSGR